VPHQFLSEDWFAAAEELRDSAPTPAGMQDVVLNIVVGGGPDGEVPMRLEAGRLERGLSEGAPTTVRVPYDLAKKMFVDGDQMAGMQGFMSGQIKVEGDMSKLMSMQRAGGPTAEEKEFQQRLQAITA
jgi:hypothetical protein